MRTVLGLLNMPSSPLPGSATGLLPGLCAVSLECFIWGSQFQRVSHDHHGWDHSSKQAGWHLSSS